MSGITTDSAVNDKFRQLRNRQVQLPALATTVKQQTTRKRSLSASALEGSDSQLQPLRRSPQSAVESGTDENIQDFIKEFKQIKLNNTVQSPPEFSDSDQGEADIVTAIDDKQVHWKRTKRTVHITQT